MTREDIKGLIPEIADDVLNKIMDINGSDINKAKAKVDELTERLTQAKETITSLETAKGDTEALQAELEKYKQAEADRIEAEKQKAIDTEYLNRFDACVGDAKFVNALTKEKYSSIVIRYQLTLAVRHICRQITRPNISIRL